MYIMWSGSPIEGFHDISAMSGCSRYFRRYAPHSIVWIFARTPICARLAWMTVAISTGDCIPEPDSGTRNPSSKPPAYPASLSSAQDVADDRLLVHGVVQRLPHAPIFQDRMARVEGDVPHRRGVALGHDEVGVAAELVEAVRRHVHREIDVAGLQRHQTRLRLDDRHVDGLPDLRRAAPVRVVAREHDLHARLPRLELE